MEMKPMIIVQDLSWKYQDMTTWALQNLTCTIASGEVVAITGASGAGKSTLLLAIADLIPTNYHGELEGSVEVHGSMGIVFQDPESQFLGMTVEEEIAFALENLGWNDERIEGRIKEALELVGLSGFEHRSPFNLSGGEKQRVAIASALAMEPEILLLDEPTSELDPAGAKQIFELVKRLKVTGMTILIATHALEEIAGVADRIMLLNQGREQFFLEPASYFRNSTLLQESGLTIPEPFQFYHWLLQQEIIPSDSPLPTELKAWDQLLLPDRKEVK